MTIDSALLERHGLKPDEYDRIVKALGREPSITELGIFSVMWSEHCSYKSSRIHLRKLPTQGPRVLQGPGENAGAVDIGSGLAAVFKIESHNHPSFIEPYQGAATGVGGIIRDIFTMGARPIALLNSLRFGPLDGPTGARTRRIVEGVVAGIGGYGNSIGIATIGGEIAFEEPYAGNPLVNVMCLGIVEADALVKGKASGVGNPVYYVGAKTGRDGIHGATMASAEFDDRSAEKRPAVQVGDPFMEKLLLEACLELMATDALIGVQDMGAAGLTCSTCEMGARGGAGIEIDVRHVPQRETGMTPYEIMLSESQERMLLVVKHGREHEVEAIFDKWDLHASHIGFVTDDGVMRVKDGGQVVAQIPNTALVDDAPLYDRPTARPGYLDEVRRLDLSALRPASPTDALMAVLASPTIASKRWVYRQYDNMVRTNTLVLAGMGAGVVRIKGTPRALAMSTDGNGRHCYLDPRRGAMLAVAEAARNVACAGATPIGATNCLNFGNPEKPEIMWGLVEAIEGIGEACRALDVPITGGNVSLYNETDGNAIYPTPIIGVVGVIEDAACTRGRAFRTAGRHIVLLGATRASLGGSEYLKTVHGLVAGEVPHVDLAAERALIDVLVSAAAERLIESAHDCADGGLAVTLAECAFDSGGIGLTSDVRSPESGGADAWTRLAALFGEGGGRAVVSVAPEHLTALESLASEAGVPAAVIGRTGGGRISIAIDGQPAIDCALEEAELLWSASLGRYFAGRAALIVARGARATANELMDELKEECGVFGIFGHPEASSLTSLGLYALQHRGQESAGIAVGDGTRMRVVRGMGQVADAFKEDTLAGLGGHLAIGHTRYSTAGDSSIDNAQPFLIDCAHGQIAVAHNGNLVNARELRDDLVRAGSIFQTTSDTEVVLHLYARSKAPTVEEALVESVSQVSGAFSMVLLTKNRLIAARDPHGFRPLALGKLGDAWIVCSETCALDLIGATYEREIEPGELLIISDGGLRSIKPYPPAQLAHCVFEHVYFARPDSYVFGKSVNEVRTSFGRILAAESPVPADVVVPIPDSGVCAAIGYGEASGIPLRFGLIRNHYVGRTFIQPQQSIRDFGVKVKLNPVRSILEGKRVVLVDDSIVRGTTSRKIVRLVKAAGASEVHVRISCPPTVSPCFYGVDTPSRKDLIGATHSIPEIRDFLEADSLAYLSLKGLREAVGDTRNTYCTSCYTGVYPVSFPQNEEAYLQLALKAVD